jgi:hypothetical protein
MSYGIDSILLAFLGLGSGGWIQNSPLLQEYLIKNGQFLSSIWSWFLLHYLLRLHSQMCVCVCVYIYIYILHGHSGRLKWYYRTLKNVNTKGSSKSHVAGGCILKPHKSCVAQISTVSCKLCLWWEWRVKSYVNYSNDKKHLLETYH